MNLMAQLSTLYAMLKSKEESEYKSRTEDRKASILLAGGENGSDNIKEADYEML